MVIADTRRLESSFAAIDYFERRGLAFIVAVNCFDDAPVHTVLEVREALTLDDDIQIVLCDARDRSAAKMVLLTLMEYLIASADPAGSP